jgi:hypothetical protein
METSRMSTRGAAFTGERWQERENGTSDEESVSEFVEVVAPAPKRQKKNDGGNGGDGEVTGDGQGAPANSTTKLDGKKKCAVTDKPLGAQWPSKMRAAHALTALCARDAAEEKRKEDDKTELIEASKKNEEGSSVEATTDAAAGTAPMQGKPAASVKSFISNAYSEFFMTGEPYMALLTISLDQNCTKWISGKGAEVKSMTKAKLKSAHQLCLCLLCAEKESNMTIDDINRKHSALQNLLKDGEAAARLLVKAGLQKLSQEPDSEPSEQIKEAYTTLLAARKELTTMHRRVYGMTHTKHLDEHLDSKHNSIRPGHKAAGLTVTAASSAALATAADGVDNDAKFCDTWISFRKLTSMERKFITSLYTTYIASTTLPMSAAESPALRELVFQVGKFFANREMTSTQPTPRPDGWYDGPCRQTVASNIMAVQAHIVNNGLQAFQEVLYALERNGIPGDVRLAAIVGDLWRSPSGADMLAVQLCFVTKDWSFVKYLVLFEEVTVRKTGEQLAQIIEDYFKRVWKRGRLLDLVDKAVFDGAANNIKMCEHLNIDMRKCMAHTLNNASKKAVAAIVANRMGKQMTILDALSQAQAALPPQVPGGDAALPPQVPGGEANDGDNGDELAALYRAAADDADEGADDADEGAAGAVEGAAGALEGTAGVAPEARSRQLGQLFQNLFKIGALSSKSSAFNKALSLAQKDYTLPVLSLPARNTTRWTSEFRLLRRCLEGFEALEALVLDAGRKKPRYGYTFNNRSSSDAGTDGAAMSSGIETFHAGDQQLLEHVLAVMEPVNTVMTQLQAEFMPCGWAWLTLRMLYMSLDETREVQLSDGSAMVISGLQDEARQLAAEYRKQLRAYFKIDEMPKEEVLLSLGLDYQCRLVLRLHGSQPYGRDVGGDIQKLKALQQRRKSSAAEKSRAPLQVLQKAPDALVSVAGSDIRLNVISALLEAYVAVVNAEADALAAAVDTEAAAAVEGQGSPAGAEAIQACATAATQAQTPRQTRKPGQLFADICAFDDDAPVPEDDDPMTKEYKTFWTYIFSRPAEAPSLEYKGHKDESGSLAWWRRNESKYAILALFARKSFAVPSTSVMPEALFSRVKYLESDQQKGRQRAELLAARAVFREGMENQTSRLSAVTIANIGEKYRQSLRAGS